MPSPKPPMPPGYYRVFGGLAVVRLGRSLVGATPGEEVTVWDADTGARVTDLLADDGVTAVSASRVTDAGVVAPVGIPASVLRPLFQVGETGVFLPPGSDAPSGAVLDVSAGYAADAASSAATAAGARDAAVSAADEASASADAVGGLLVDGLVNPELMPGGTSLGDTGRRYRKVLGVLRNDGSGWAFINDAGHRPTGVSASTPVTVTSTGIVINYGFAGERVASLTVTPDETFAALGIRAGASVGVDSATIQLFRQSPHFLADYVYYSGTEWVSFLGVFAPSYNSSTGTLTLTHEDMGTTGHQAIQATPRGSAAALAGGFTATTSQVVFGTGAWGSLTATGAASSAQHKVYVTRFGQRSSVTPADPASIVSTSGNLWVIGEIEVAP